MADNYIARTTGTWMIVGTLPDVCKTPMGSSTPPIPYPVVAKLSDSSSPL
ncbi:PAAR-like domain-containing protein [Xenorhabdus sp. SGI240]